MAKNLKDLAGRDLTFIDENQENITGTLMYLDGFLNNKYFFVPYDKKAPFKISSKGPHKVCVSGDHTKIYGQSNNLNNLANEKELESLAQFEGMIRACDPAAEIQGRAGPCLIKLPNGKYTNNISEMNFPSWAF